MSRSAPFDPNPPAPPQHGDSFPREDAPRAGPVAAETPSGQADAPRPSRRGPRRFDDLF
ncbi:MAG: hypothetical protein R3C16_09990 [Hyphomonadaceae bacterium]